MVRLRRPLLRHSVKPRDEAPKCDGTTCTVGALLDLEATPRRMHVWINGEPLDVECPYDFPPTHGPWRPSVCIANSSYVMFSDAQTY